jgi:hypothetical protein
MLEPKIQRIYRPLVDSAWRAECARTGQDPADKIDREKWYRDQLVVGSGLGIFSTKQIKHDDCEAIDALLLHFATLANDTAMIKWVTESPERRARWRLAATMRNAGVSDAYVSGILRNMGYADRTIADLPADIILKVNTAVYLHWRRHRQPEEAVA